MGPLGADPFDEADADLIELLLCGSGDRQCPGAVFDDRMAAAEGETNSLDAIGSRPARRIHPDIGEVLTKVALVGRQRMIPVHAVFDQQLPIRLHAVGLRAVYDLNVLAAEVEHVVEIFTRVTEISDQALDRRIEADEHHAAIAFEVRHWLEAERITVESRSVGVVARDANEPPAEVKGPGVIKAA